MRSGINRIVILILLSIFSAGYTQSQQQSFSFVQLCDPQLGMEDYEHDISNFNQAVKQINKLTPDFVIICGDLVQHASDSSFSKFLEIKSEIQIPCYIAPGNHDVKTQPNDTSLNYYRSIIGDDYFAFNNKGYTFIIVNTQLWKVDVNGESEKHDNWFKETIMNSSNNKNPIIVVGHYPLYIENPEEEEKYFNLPVNKRKELLEIFHQNNVVAYLSGHRHKLIINNYNNIQLVSGESTSKNFDKKPLGFRVWEVKADTISNHFVPLDLEKQNMSE